MGLFSGIIDSIKDISSYIADTTINLFGSVTDMFKPEKEPLHVISYETLESSEVWYEDMYEDYKEWFKFY